MVGGVLLPLLPASVLSPGTMRVIQGTPNVVTTHFAFSPGGETFATVQMDGQISLWDVTRGWRIARTIGHRGYARAAAFSSDGRWLAIGGTDPDIVVYDRSSNDSEHPMTIPLGGVTALVFSPDGRVLAASSSRHREILLWDLATGRELSHLRGHASPVFSLAMAPDGRSLASGGRSDGKILIWDLASGQPRFQLEVPGSPVMALAYSPDGSLLASAGLCEIPIRIWDSNSGRLQRSIGSHSSAASAKVVSFSRDGRMLAFAACDGKLELWSLVTGRQLGCLDAQVQRLRGVEFSPDGTTLVATGFDHDIRIWKLADLPRAEPEAKP